MLVHSTVFVLVVRPQVFLPVLDLLHAPKASVSMLVFSLPDVLNDERRESTISQLRTQLDSFAVHASSSPLILVGTRKDEACQAGGGAGTAPRTHSSVIFQYEPEPPQTSSLSLHECQLIALELDQSKMTSSTLKPLSEHDQHWP